MKIFGVALISIGFLAGAFLASLDPKEMQWSYYAPALIVGGIGVFLIKRTAKTMAHSSDTLTRNKADIESSLSKVIENLKGLESDKEGIPTHAMRLEIDKRFREDLTRFAEARKSMIHLYGLRAYADIMSAFAAGERYINRVWSASADGYVDEVRQYLTMALTQFEEAQAKLQAAIEARG